MSAPTATGQATRHHTQATAPGLGTAVQLNNVSKTYGTTTAMAHVNLTIEAGSSLALIGPSGSGKTTVLRSIAGLITPDTGDIWLGEDHVNSPQHNTPTERRGIGMVFQDWALFPHLSVAGNVGYGLHRHPDKTTKIKRALDLVQLNGFENRRIHEVSGGQAQRVALARALATEPRVLLFDEAFSSLDTNLRHDVCAHTAHLMHDLGITAIYVTHDRREANTLGDHVAVLRNGTVVQSDTPSDLYRAPVSPWVAEFTGEANLIPATAQGNIAHTCIGQLPLHAVREGACQVLVRPEQLRLTPAEPATAHGMITDVLFGGHETTYEIIIADVPLTVRELGMPRFSVGHPIEITYTGDPLMSYSTEAPPE